MLMAILFAAVGNAGWSDGLHATIIFQEVFSGAGSLPAGWTSTTPGSLYPAPWNDVTVCGGMSMGTVACSESPPYRTVYEILESPVINLPPSSGQSIWLRFDYGASGMGHFILAQISVNAGGSWSPYTTLLMPASNTSGQYLSSINQYVQNATAMRLRFIHATDTLKGYADTGYVWIDSVVVFMDSIAKPREDTTPDCCNLTYRREGALVVRPHDYWWEADSVPYSTQNYITLCNPCTSELIYQGTLSVNGNVVHDSTYTFPPDTCILIQWDSVALSHGSNAVEFELSPAGGPACGPINVGTSVYIFTDTTNIGGGDPPGPPWCPIQPCVVGPPVIVDTFITVGGVDIGICDIIKDCNDWVVPPSGYRLGIRTIFDPGPPVPDTAMMSMFIYQPGGDTIVDTLMPVIVTPDGTIIDIILIGIPEIPGDARIAIQFPDTPVPLHWIPMEYADADSIRIFMSDWIPMSSLGIRAYPYVSILFVDPSTGGMEFLPGGEQRKVMVDMPSKRVYLEGRGTFILTTVSGRVIMNESVSDRRTIHLRNLAPGIYLYRFGGISGKIVIR